MPPCGYGGSVLHLGYALPVCVLRDVYNGVYMPPWVCTGGYAQRGAYYPFHCWARVPALHTTRFTVGQES